MDTFIETFSFTFGIVAALALLPFLFVLVSTGIPNLIMALIVRFASKEWKERKWKRALENGDESLIKFLRKHGLDRAESQ
jgi:hypothetical protein